MLQKLLLSIFSWKLVASEIFSLHETVSTLWVLRHQHMSNYFLITATSYIQSWAKNNWEWTNVCHIGSRATTWPQSQHRLHWKATTKTRVPDWVEHNRSQIMRSRWMDQLSFHLFHKNQFMSPLFHNVKRNWHLICSSPQTSRAK